MKRYKMKNKIQLILFSLFLGVSLQGSANKPPVASECIAEFDYSYVPTTPIHVQFTDLSTGFPNVWFWDFGDGSTSSEQNPVHPYTLAGEYEVCLVIQHSDTSYNCSDTICKTIVIPDSVECEAIFTYDINPNYPLEVSFLDHSIGNITNWEWNFGDGTISYEKDPVHFFQKSGEYLVCLNVSHSDSTENCFHFICETLNISDSINFKADYLIVADSNSNILYQYSFYDQSIGYPDHWLWDFGDGNTSHNQHPIHVYDEPGLYEVCLNSWNSNFAGCNDVQCKMVQTSSYYKLGGQAFIGSAPINNPYHTGDTGIAILYRQRPNLSLVAVDTNIFYEHGYYWFNDKMELPYVVRIGLTPGSENYKEVIPSYYPSSMIWQQAGPVSLEQDIFDVHISLKELLGVDPGIAEIHGRIVEDNRWELINGPDYSYVPIMLTDLLSQPLSWTQTNDHGQFSFEDISYGSYLIYADIAGIYSLPESVTLDENIPVADSIFISMYNTAPNYIEDPDQETFSILSLYPNPAGNRINLNITAIESTAVDMIIYNQLGQKVLTKTDNIYIGENKLEVNISNLPAGIYFLRLQATTSKPLMSTFIKID